MLKKHQLKTIHDTVAPFYVQDSPSPHNIIELSSGEVKRLKSNIIHISNLSYVKNKEEKTIMTTYDNVTYGCNIRNTKIFFDNSRYDLININKIRRGFIVITADKLLGGDLVIAD